MNRGVRYIIIVVAFLLQPFLSAMLPLWMVPDLCFCILVAIMAVADPDEYVGPVILIFALALVKDIYSCQFVGVTVIAMIITSIFILLLRRSANIENIVFIGILALASNLVYYIAYWAIYAILSSPYSFLYMVRSIGWVVLPNIVVTFITLLIISRRMIVKKRDKYFR